MHSDDFTHLIASKDQISPYYDLLYVKCIMHNVFVLLHVFLNRTHIHRCRNQQKLTAMREKLKDIDVSKFPFTQSSLS